MAKEIDSNNQNANQKHSYLCFGSMSMVKLYAKANVQICDVNKPDL